MDLSGKVALVTGGGTGIGAGCARRFAREGARVAVMGRRPEMIGQVAAEINGLAVCGDASSTTDVRAALDAVVKTYGGLDILVTCAGTTDVGAALETDDALWARCLSSNLTSAFVAARESLPFLIERRGTIVIVSSIAGLAAGPDVCGYVTTKHALIGLTRSLARDYGPQGVRANAVCPGWVITPMGDMDMVAIQEREGISREEAYVLVTQNVPLRRPATAEEIAAACLFLASGEASIITGAVLVADGGATVVDLPTLAFAQ